MNKSKDDQVETGMAGEKSVRSGVTQEDDTKSAGKEESLRRGRSQTKTVHMSQAGNVDKSAKSRGISCVTSTPIRKVTIENLKEQLRRLHLPTMGNTAELQRRLEAYEDAPEESDDNSDPENDTIIENANPQESNDDDEDEDDQEAG